MKQVGVLGSGQVGEVLANAFLTLGYAVKRGSRSPEKLQAWADEAGSNASVGTFAETAQFAEVVVLAVKGNAAEAVLEGSGAEHLSGKVVIDTTNPIADAPPEQGVLRFFTDINDSLMERLQRKFPSAHLVKAFSSVGNPLMFRPDFGDTKPTMFICGNDVAAKTTVTSILGEFGWETSDMGGSIAARAIEPLCMLWCIPGLTGKGWDGHAFKLLRR